MTGPELRLLLKELELSQVTFARLLGVTARAVNMWILGKREVPAPVEAYLRLFVQLSIGQRLAEIEKAAGKKPSMREGMYQISFHKSGNPENWGIGTLVFGGGTIYGADAGGAKYDGTYEPTGVVGIVNARVKVTFSPNVVSIFGIAHPYEWSIEVATQLDSRNERGDIIVVTNLGQNVSASYQYLRALPEAA